LLPASSKTLSILIIRLSSLGDVLLTTPAVRSLRNTFPSARIDFMLKEQYAELLQNNPHISSIITFPEPADFDTLNRMIAKLRDQYDIIIDLHTSLRSYQLRKRLNAGRVLKYKKRRLLRWLLVNCKRDYYPQEFSIPTAYIEAMKPLGVVDDGTGLEWHITEDKVQRFLEIAELNEKPPQKPVALCPGASFATKRWDSERWMELAEKMAERNHLIWVFGDESDREVGERIQTIYSDRIINLCGKLSLAEAGAGFDECPKEHFCCMKDISVDRVMEFVRELEEEIGE